METDRVKPKYDDNSLEFRCIRANDYLCETMKFCRLEPAISLEENRESSEILNENIQINVSRASGQKSGRLREHMILIDNIYLTSLLVSLTTHVSNY